MLQDEVFVSNSDEKTTEAKQELLEKLGEYLPCRFPDIFERTSSDAIWNKVFGEQVSLNSSDKDDPLIRAGNRICDSLILLFNSKSIF